MLSRSIRQARQIPATRQSERIQTRFSGGSAPAH
jgi:hypothetical protein